ncbi:MAG: hypothetical protein GY822_06805 [Deltaproteobacteria bacterium]|nr:hypothetical protein [Deltaproteobacteria bacterium]
MNLSKLRPDIASISGAAVLAVGFFAAAFGVVGEVAKIVKMVANAMVVFEGRAVPIDGAKVNVLFGSPG